MPPGVIMRLLLCTVSLLIVSTSAFNFKLHCGQRKERAKRIVGGTPSGEDAWPWQVYIRQRQTNGEIRYCGGTVIGERWILTAAHCRGNPYMSVTKSFHAIYNVTTGDYADDADLYSSNIDDFIAHPNYKPLKDPKNFTNHLMHMHWIGKSSMHDIALVKLKEALTWSDHLQAICLPENDDQLEDGETTAFIAGWGGSRSQPWLEEFNETQALSDVLLQAEVPVHFTDRNPFAVAIFQDEYSNTTLHSFTSNGTGPCDGDYGGPLMRKSSDTSGKNGGFWFQHGIMSSSFSLEIGPTAKIGCGYNPGVAMYTRVSKYCAFIKEKTNGEVTCLDPSQ